MVQFFLKQLVSIHWFLAFQWLGGLEAVVVQVLSGRGGLVLLGQTLPGQTSHFFFGQLLLLALDLLFLLKKDLFF